ncbi:DUF21 domain-containing protein [Glycine soja]|uniref:DUF21 domain-containing protein n=1 Tax=Glycine soja TaxID=3848 RepID=A0A445IYC9_GLYSO|nr:DUF21 domain-containing protein [Glycine soja]
MAAEIPCCGTKFSLYVLVIIGLVCFAGLMAGLTLGLMSFGLVDLEVLIKSGRPQDRIHASKIYPVVKNQHLLLCTLLIGNSLAMEALPIFLDSLVHPAAAILISVTLILMFGEILPQATCTRYGLTVGATLAPLVRVLLIVFFPLSYPISKVLDWMLGKGHAALLKRAELKTFVNFHGNELQKYDAAIHFCEQSQHLAETNFVLANNTANSDSSLCDSYSSVKLWRWSLKSNCYFCLGRLEASLNVLEKLQQVVSVTDKCVVDNIEDLLTLASTIRELLKDKVMHVLGFDPHAFAHFRDERKRRRN